MIYGEEMNIINMPIGDVKPYDNNPRRNSEAVKYVAESIQQFGWKQPIVVDKDHVIIVGHTRWLAAATLGLEEVPVLIADDLTPEQVKAYRLADNKTGEIATWDFDLLALELGDLELDMTDFGFAVDDYEEPKEDDPEDEPTQHKNRWIVTAECANEMEAENVADYFAEVGIKCKVRHEEA